MGVGTAIVLALGIAGLFPLALAGAAVLVPLLAALYLHDVDVYEEAPALVIGFTLAWGAASGVVIALLGHALGASEPHAGGHRASRTSALVTVVLLPILELVLAVAGPALVLLPHRRFNDVLDGVTFGAATRRGAVGDRGDRQRLQAVRARSRSRRGGRAVDLAAADDPARAADPGDGRDRRRLRGAVAALPRARRDRNALGCSATRSRRSRCGPRCSSPRRRRDAGCRSAHGSPCCSCST